jgi:hypothetical protein
MKQRLIKLLSEAKTLCAELDEFEHARTLKLMIHDLERESDEFNFKGNTGQVNICRGNSKMNAEQTIVKKFSL